MLALTMAYATLLHPTARGPRGLRWARRHRPLAVAVYRRKSSMTTVPEAVMCLVAVPHHSGLRWGLWHVCSGGCAGLLSSSRESLELG